ncbi:hypothetical protein [Pseudidiomarina homiensis]|uniref:DUF3566 domain-containing protein n=2 Tax=Pseudidiomarina homiensis TaxID=364198 RepID=A0A432Y761_9GAMM|nr:hypothetical protein [Pseudidiomarina homiensis]RUO56819.1 hypothetical protein CWI70_08825 [Pseudidiomarina homiensis]
MKRLSYIAPHKAGVVCGMVAAGVSVVILFPLSILMAVISAISGADGGVAVTFGFSLFSITLAPLFYGITTYIFALIAAWMYNLVAQKTGGIAYRTEQEQEQNV